MVVFVSGRWIQACPLQHLQASRVWPIVSKNCPFTRQWFTFKELHLVFKISKWKMQNWPVNKHFKLRHCCKQRRIKVTVKKIRLPPIVDNLYLLAAILTCFSPLFYWLTNCLLVAVLPELPFPAPSSSRRKDTLLCSPKVAAEAGEVLNRPDRALVQRLSQALFISKSTTDQLYV